MSGDAQQLSNRWRYALFAVAFVVAVGMLTAPWRLIAPWHHLFQSVLGLSLVVLGLVMLFPLAAFGPKNEKQAASRITEAGMGVSWVLFGTSSLVSHAGLSFVVLVSSMLFLLASRVMAPRRAG